MHDLLFSLWLALQDDAPPDDDPGGDDDAGSGLPAPVPPAPVPGRWPPRVRLFLPHAWEPVPVPATVGV